MRDNYRFLTQNKIPRLIKYSLFVNVSDFLRIKPRVRKKKKHYKFCLCFPFADPRRARRFSTTITSYRQSSIVNLQSRIVKVGDMSKNDGTPASYFISSLTCHHSHSRLCALTTGSEWRVYLALLQFLGTLS